MSDPDTITLELANAIIAGALAKARAEGFKPMGVVVSDPGGHVIAFQREDGASTLRMQIATAKAAGALSLGVSSRRVAEMAVERPAFVASLASLAPQGILPAAGGVLIAGRSGRLIGAVGVTGDTSDNDEICAMAGLAAVGLSAL